MGCAIKPFEDLQSKHDRRQMMCNDRIFLTFPKTGETKDGLGDACLSKLDPFFRQRNAKPLRASTFKRS
jgi:hypothetical protein